LEQILTATDAIAETYEHLHLLKENFPPKGDPTSVQVALRFLFHNGETNARPGQIDCLRCISRAWNVLADAPDEFVKEFAQYWNTMGAVSGQLLRRADPAQVDVEPARRILWFMERFDEVDWGTRVNVVAGFGEFAKKLPRRSRDRNFWSTLEHFRKFCHDRVSSEPSLIAEIAATTRALIDVWMAITQDFGTSEDVREEFARSGRALFELIILTREYEKGDALGWWKAALLNLKLTEADPFHGDYPHSDRARIQKHLEDLIRLLKEQLAATAAQSAVHRWIEDAMERLLPYLHGRVSRPSRGRFDERERAGFLTLQSAGVAVASLPVIVEDLCLRSYRGFRVTVPNIVLAEARYEGSVGLNGNLIDKRPCRTVACRDSDGGVSYVVDWTSLVLRRSISGKPTDFEFPCGVLRAWKIDHTSSGWILYAQPDMPFLESWRQTAHEHLYDF
jgi:hypothetical protein